MSLVSVVIPYRNRAAFLAKTLQSVVDSDYRPLELLLVNNHSTDNSEEVARAFFKSHSVENVTVHYLNEEKPGAAVARNRGLQEVSGEMVYFFDSDDELSPDFFSWAVATLREHDADVVATATRMVWPDGCETLRKYLKRLTLSGQILTGQLATQSMFFRTEWLRQQGGWNASVRFWDDWELGVRVLLSRPKMVWDACRVYHHVLQHDDSLTGTSLSASFASLTVAFESVETQLRSDVTLAGRAKRRAWRALAYREAIVAGTLFTEGHADDARQTLDRALGIAPDRSSRMFSRILYHYTRCGGRGAWRIALWGC